MEKSKTHLILTAPTELLQVAIRQVVYISADGNYSNIHLAGGDVRQVSYQIGQIEDLLDKRLDSHYNRFMRVGKSLIINLDYVFRINIPNQQLIMCDNAQGRYTLSPSREALVSLKSLIEG